jgi:demethylmenaquinone methyltransferase/2-methoxy-6-polyprenyl-1,4-benzoquinol methylase
VIGQFYRVLRPGGRAVILEFSTPTWAPWRGIYQFYFHQVMPRTASWISGDRTGAYRYLPRSVDTFIDRPQMMRLMEQAGFERLTLRPLTFGIAVIYTGTKPGNATEPRTDNGAGRLEELCA